MCRHSDCLQLLAIISEGAVTIHVQIFVESYTPFLLNKQLGVGLLGHIGSLYVGQHF